MTIVHRLDDLTYSNDRKGPFRFYVYGPDGFHSGGTWVSKEPEVDEISPPEMMELVLEAAAQGLEVRICDPGDELIYHSKGSEVLYPKPIGAFWREICD